ncbi:transcriptional regulator [Devosia epidermidihirudinis]|uniref:Transcriptional regulator n=1 Tax=Devosia epidermidihirudinis TaxID=1293439 RepID=A0A0F5QDJ7_9HYPH|nr:LacI family DNA-binding transcriptional regulator [Devosia epidermidihirudinis]KKC38074.1 transcriptional regulator [Devosia epidermidihirudinis]
MGKSIIRLKDIADRTGFSVNTVSLALRQSPRIPEETAQLIREAAEALNYLPNQVAKSLVSRETKTIGLVLTDITIPTLTRTAQAMELALAERGYSTLFATSNNDPAEERRVIEMFRSRQVDGMLIYPHRHRELDHIHKLRRANYPIVLLVGDPSAGIDAVCIDEFDGAFRAVQHLTEMGHVRIGILDSSNPIGNSEKLEGYVKALSDADIAFDASLFVDPQGHSVIRGFWAMDTLMSKPDRPTAVFCANDSLALGALRWTQKHGLRVPDEIAIIGFDNIEFAEHAATPISSVHYDVQMVTDLAVDRLVGLIKAGDKLPAPRVTMIEPSIIVRESTNGRVVQRSGRAL